MLVMMMVGLVLTVLMAVWWCGGVYNVGVVVVVSRVRVGGVGVLVAKEVTEEQVAASRRGGRRREWEVERRRGQCAGSLLG